MHRVLHVVTTLDPGGAESHLLAVAGATRARGHGVDVAYLRGDPAREAPFRQRGVETFRLGASRRPGPWAVAALARLLERGGYSVVHAHLVEGELAAALALALAPGPAFVLSKHN